MRVGNTQKVSGKLLPSLLFNHTVGDLLPPRGGGTPHIKGVGMLLRNFELNPKRDQNNIHIKYSIYFYIFSRATLNETFTAKCDAFCPEHPK